MGTGKRYFEEITSQEHAYWLGWIITDGGICDRRYKLKVRTPKQTHSNVRYVSLKLAEKDRSIVKAFAKVIGVGALRRREARSGWIHGKTHSNFSRSTPSWEFTIFSKDMIEDLARYGIYQNKTLTIKFPKNVPAQFYPGLIAGMISGDGCVGRRKNHGTNPLLYSNLAGTKDLLLGVKEILVRETGFDPSKKISYKRQTKALHVLELNQTETIALYHWMKANDIQLMPRKWRIIEDQIKYLSKRISGSHGQKPVEVTELATGDKFCFESAKAAALYLGMSHVTVSYYAKRQRIPAPYAGIVPRYSFRYLRAA